MSLSSQSLSVPETPIFHRFPCDSAPVNVVPVVVVVPVPPVRVVRVGPLEVSEPREPLVEVGLSLLSCIVFGGTLWVGTESPTVLLPLCPCPLVTSPEILVSASWVLFPQSLARRENGETQGNQTPCPSVLGEPGTPSTNLLSPPRVESWLSWSLRSSWSPRPPWDTYFTSTVALPSLPSTFSVGPCLLQDPKSGCIGRG